MNYDTSRDILSLFNFSDIKLRVLKDIFKKNIKILKYLVNIKLSNRLLNKVNTSGTLFREGTYSNIYLMTNKDKNEYIAKLNKDNVDFNDFQIIEDVIQEMSYHHIFALQNLGPSLYDKTPFLIDISSGYYTINMKKYDGDLSDLFKINKSQSLINYVEMKIHHCINRIFDLGLICHDLKPQNILVNYDDNGNLLDLVITDFDIKWCSKIKGREINNNIIKFINENRYHFQLFSILPIVVMSLRLNVIIFRHEMSELYKIIKSKKFYEFIDYVIFNDFFSEKIYPVFYYIIHYFKNSKTNFKFFNDKEKSTTKYSVYLISHFIKIYKKKILKIK